MQVSKKKGGGERSQVATITGMCMNSENKITVGVPGYMVTEFSEKILRNIALCLCNNFNESTFCC
jgi:hypothetical protein